jgi:uncharacterized protein DUF2795
MAPTLTDVQKALKGADYPATREDLMELAERNGAGEDVVEALRRAEDDEFDGPDQVMASLKGQVSGR